MEQRCYFVPYARPFTDVTDVDVDAGAYQWWSEARDRMWYPCAWMNTTDGVFRHGKGFVVAVPVSYLTDGERCGTMVRVW